jgi:signal transduction histidine kinase
VLGSDLTPTQRHSLNLAQRNVTRIQRLTSALLDFSRIEAGKLEGRFTPTNLSIFVTDIAALFRPAIERMRIDFTIDVQDYNGNVVIDPTLFETVVTNLLSNALKYTEHGRIGLRLSYDTYAELVITDTGIGIASSDFDTVTDRFSRAGSGKTRAIEGTGIGLALVKEIVRLHGGEFVFKSKTQEEGGDDHGSTFTVRIPLSSSHSSAEFADGYTFGRYSKQLAEEALHRAPPIEESEHTESLSFVERQEDEFMFEATDVLLVVDDTADMSIHFATIQTLLQSHHR